MKPNPPKALKMLQVRTVSIVLAAIEYDEDEWCAAFDLVNVSAGCFKVQFHKERLGRQSYTFVNEDRHRVWVWDRTATDGYRVKVSDFTGIAFEVLPDLNLAEAVEAWNDYVKALGRPEHTMHVESADADLPPKHQRCVCEPIFSIELLSA